MLPPLSRRYTPPDSSVSAVIPELESAAGPTGHRHFGLAIFSPASGSTRIDGACVFVDRPCLRKLHTDEILISGQFTAKTTKGHYELVALKDLKLAEDICILM